jgi:S-adenosylmethionine synthetase
VSSWTFTSESVTEGHPDKMADQISDAILDAMLEQDPMSRVACETFVTTGLAIVGGEITTNGYVDIPKVVRSTINEIGYSRESYGYDGNTVGVLVSLDEQSSDIAQGVDDSEEVRSGTSGEDLLNKQGAGDQGMMFGYACDETDALMPLPIHLAHRMAERLAEVRRAGTVPYLRPDGKTQVTFDYTDGKPTRLRTVLISTQHNDGIDRDEVIRPDLIEHVIRPVVPAQFADDDYEVFVNPTGRFVIGGPVGDAGLTGRKIIVDTYGGMGRHGGGAFSGKDPSKVDRSAAYAARWVAKNVVASGAASRCEVQVAYAIGVAHPVSVMIETFGTETVDNARIVDAVTQLFDLRPAAILRDLDLRRPIYKRTAAYGHFGRAPENGGFTWERTDKVDDLRSALGL